jgi:two-component system chemotaxis response regulator CheB
LPVIMFSRFTQRGAAVTLEALTLGASDYVTMPDSIRVAEGLSELRNQLIYKIRELCPRDDRSSSSRCAGALTPAVSPRPASTIRKSQRVEVLAIGASTGGPNALATMLSGLPADCPVPIVIVQHMPATFTGLLAERLTSRGTLAVSEGTLGQALFPNRAWLAPGDFHMEVACDAQDTVRLRLHQGPPENSCRPSVDVLFRSVAETYGAGTLAVVMTGMGQDGLRGCERIREVGGQVLTQDEASSVVWGMPGLVARAGLADQILPLDELAPEIIRRLRRGRSLSSPA